MTRIPRTSGLDARAKGQFIAAFFDDLAERTRFANEFYNDDHRNEAMTLCCCYIDGLANLLYHDSDRSAFNFVRLLSEHGRRPELARVSPLSLVRWLENKSKRLATIARKLKTGLAGNLTKVMDEAEFERLIRGILTTSEAASLSGERWRATLAFVAYTHLRVPSVYQTGAPGAVIVGTFGNDPTHVVRISFEVMYAALEACISTVRDLSLRTNKWFGHDRVA